MTDFTDPDAQERLQSYLNIHLKKDELDLDPGGQLEALNKKRRNKWIQLVVNVAAIIFFGYSFYYDITQLGETFFYIIVGVFLVNVGLIFYQKNQLDELEQYLQWKQENEG
jgi:Tfp pilus assembly protein PilO